ncbi:hypothetical protein Goshw_015563 [Gossypium schwendimanii]|uniref:Uncharacterized protein n=1 Tax=Gossypium schwendimanii TaxID=34291 RepID=A0A7J9KLK7_GOSSC|nr:hypothetical protein [Gossypium schwendimanii]
MLVWNKILTNEERTRREMDEIFKIEAQTIVEGMKLAWLKDYKQVEIVIMRCL